MAGLAPMLGGLVGSFLGGGATLAGMTSVGGIIGGIAGTVIAGSLLGGDKTKSAGSSIIPQTTPQTPATPPAPAMPAVPSAPAATPTVPSLGGSVEPKPTPGAATDTTAPTAGVDVGAGQPVVSTPDPTIGTDITPATPEDVAKGTLERKRKGRLSTILTKRNRLSEEEEEVERLGG